MAAHRNGALRDVTRALFGGWRAALRAAGVDPVRRGRPPKNRAALAMAPIGPPSPETFGLPQLACRVCGEWPPDLVDHVIRAHHLSPRLYEIRHGPLPDRREVLRLTLEAVRLYLAQGGPPSEKALLRRNPALHEALSRLHLFPDIDAAFAYARPDDEKVGGE